jgi:hypothetical protein
VDYFDDQTMTAPLLDLLAAKIAKYRTRPMETECDEFVLLAFFNQGLLYNSPLQTPRRRVRVIVDDVLSSVPRDRGIFSRGFLFPAPAPGAVVSRLW